MTNFPSESDMVATALMLAHSAHADDFDRAGMPYLFHVMRVADKQVTPARKVIALLHDTVEHKKLTLEEISGIFGYAITISIEALTQMENEDYLQKYVQRIVKNRDACWVKLADIEDNTRVDRVDAKAAKKFELYKRAHEIIRKEMGINSPYFLAKLP